MGINSISEQKSNIDFQTNNVQNNNSRYYIKSNGVDKTPQSDTVQISNKKDTVKKVAIGAAIVGTAVGLFYLLRGKKPPKKVMEQAADTIADTKPKMEITEEAKKIYDDVASKFHKKTRVTSETIEQNIKPKEKAGSWSSDDMKEFYTKLEKESDAKIAAEKAAKEAEEKAAKLVAEKAAKEAEEKAAERAAKEAAEKAAKEARYNELRQYNVMELNERHAAAVKAKKSNEIQDIEHVLTEKKASRLKALNDLPKADVDTPLISSFVSKEEYRSIAKYVDTCPFNNELRKGKYDGKKLPKGVQLMDSAIEKAQPLKHDAYVYRAVSGHIFADDIKFIESIKEGVIITDKAFVSTAKDVDAQFKHFLGFGNSMALRIKLPKGTKGLNVNYSEFVLPRGAQIKVNKIDRVNGIADCEYILPDMA